MSLQVYWHSALGSAHCIVTTKSEYLQIRVSAREKAIIKRMARGAGMDVSRYALTRMITRSPEQFTSILRELQKAGSESFALAALNDLLSSLSSSELEVFHQLLPATWAAFDPLRFEKLICEAKLVLDEFARN